MEFISQTLTIPYNTAAVKMRLYNGYIDINQMFFCNKWFCPSECTYAGEQVKVILVVVK